MRIYSVRRLFETYLSTVWKLRFSKLYFSNRFRQCFERFDSAISTGETGVFENQNSGCPGWVGWHDCVLLLAELPDEVDFRQSGGQNLRRRDLWLDLADWALGPWSEMDRSMESSHFFQTLISGLIRSSKRTDNRSLGLLVMPGIPTCVLAWSALRETVLEVPNWN